MVVGPEILADRDIGCKSAVSAMEEVGPMPGSYLSQEWTNTSL